MAAQEHLEKLKEGKETWNKWRTDFPEIEPDLSGATIQLDLSGYNLAGANLEYSNLSGSLLIDAVLNGVKGKGAIFGECDLSGAHLEKAHLDLAKFTKAKLINAECRGCDFSNAILTANLGGANLDEAILKGANLNEADLRGARAVQFDGNPIREAQLAGTKSLWLELRYQYTGASMVFNLLLTSMFFLPYFVRAGAYLAVSETQHQAIDAQKALHARVDTEADAMLARLRGQLATMPSCTAPECRTVLEWQKGLDQRLSAAVGELRDAGQKQIDQLQPCLAPRCDTVPLWQILLGWDQGVLATLVGLLLIGFNVSRGILTWKVGPLRDQEDWAHTTPGLAQYAWMRTPHFLVTWLWYVALVALLWHLVEGAHYLGSPVSKPAAIP